MTPQTMPGRWRDERGNSAGEWPPLTRARDWAEIQEGQFAAAFHAVLAHGGVGQGTLHLDAGCGAGMAAALSASLGARVAGIDAAEGMLEIARERTRSGDFRQGDLEALPWGDDAFDLVTGFNAFQFASDPAKALREAGRVTRPGGMVVVTTWGDPAGMEAASLVAAMKPMLPSAPPGAPGPFALSDETALRGFGAAGVAKLAKERVGEAAFNAAISAALAPFRQPDGSIRLGARTRRMVATPG